MKTIKLLLTESVDNLGIVGDVVTVKPGYARNFLLPRGYVTEPTQRNIERLAERRHQVEQEIRKQRLDQEQSIEKMAGLELTVQRSANEQGILFGGVSQHDIAELLRGEGYEIDDRAVRIGDQIKRLDTYVIPIVLTNDLRTEVKLWVVSDKPREDLETTDQAEGEQEEATPGEQRPVKSDAKAVAPSES